jgi:triosephosphate isomerase
MRITKPIFAGNWKMNKGPSEARAFVEFFLEHYRPREDRTVVLVPPTVSLSTARDALRERDDIGLGVQHIHWEESGAYTGETSPPMAADAGATYALIGHSERRHIFGETAEDTARKVKAALAADLTPILCVGETLEDRKAGRADEVVKSQLRAALEGVRADGVSRLVLAYEPVWAIGTGETASPQDAQTMHEAIRGFLAAQFGENVARAVPILYGGSVKPANVEELLGGADVDGVLVGGASLDAESFSRICQVTA